MKIAVAVGAFLVALPIIIAGGAAAFAGSLFGSSSPAACTTTGAPGTVDGYGPDQIANAATIVAVGKQMSIPASGWIVAIAAAMQESGLHNLSSGDRDSVGLFQERPSQGWGTPAQIMDPVYATTQFYRHLAAVPNWQQMTVDAAAQAVERSAYPNAYAPHVQAAMDVVNAVDGALCAAGPGFHAPDPKAQIVVNAALSEVGVAYSWGGGTAAGPSLGTGSGAHTIGFDCSGLALFAYAKIGVAVPHQTQAIWSKFQPAITNPSNVEPGDLIILSSNGQPSGIHHVAIYAGPQQGGQVIEAPDTGQTVRLTNGIWSNTYWQHQFIGAVRPNVQISSQT